VFDTLMKKERNMRMQQGFTLIELVIVIVILGLLAATALPRFIDITQDARIASVQGLAGGLRGAASLAKAQVMVSGSNGGTISMDGTAVAVNGSGYPTGGAAGGIISAMQGIDGYTPSGTDPTTVFEPTNGGGTDCRATYNANTGGVTVLSTGC
jgi:MSHA pilin protein MshA